MASSSSASVAVAEASATPASTEATEAQVSAAAAAGEEAMQPVDVVPAKAGAGKRADMEASTSASSDDEQNALKEAAASSSFSFSRDAAEFVPKVSAFQFNPGASEFNPMMFASGQSPAQPAAGPTFLQPVPVMAQGNVPVYPVVAVLPMSGGARPFPQMAPVSALGQVSPTGAVAAVGFGPNLGFHDGGHAEPRKGGGKGQQHRQGNKGGFSPAGRNAHQQEQKNSKAAEEPEAPILTDADFPAAPGDAQRLKKGGEEQKEETKEESKEEEKEGEDEKGPKKPSWADMARKSMGKTTSPVAETIKNLPKRVPTKARSALPAAGGAPPAAGVAAPASAATAAPAAGAVPAKTSPDAATPPAGTVATGAAATTPAVPAAAPPASPVLAPAPDAVVPAIGEQSLDDALEGPPPVPKAPASSEVSGAAVVTDGDAEGEKPESSEKPKEKGPPSWADRLKASSAASPPLMRPKKGAPSKPVGIPSNPRPAPWAKAAPAPPAGAEDAPEPSSTAKDSWEAGAADKPETAVDAKVEEEADDKATAATPAAATPAAEAAADQAAAEGDVDGAEESGAEQVESEVNEPTAEETKAPATDASPKKAVTDTPNVAQDDEDDEEDVDVDGDSASTPTSVEEKNTKTEEEGVDGTASEKLASELGKPDANGIIKYSVAWLKSMAEAPLSQGTCPPNIPACLRNSEDGEAIEKDYPAEDRKRYKLAFLKQFKEKAACQELPANHKIPKDIRVSNSSPTSRNRGADGNPSFDKEDDWRADQVKHQARMKDGGRDKDRNRDRKGGRNIERRQEEVLVSSETSWAQQQQAAKQESEAKIIREMKGILNKLTIEKFDKLYQKLLECGIETQEHIEKLMSEVFEKATTQHHFISMYTDLCIRLTGWLLDRDIKGSDGKAVSFKRILLNQCQDSFEKYLKTPEGLTDLVGEELFEAKLKYKTKMLGNIKFVGQLLINKVLSSKIIFQCAFALLDNPSEEKLETLCAFLNTIGPAYDAKEWKSYDELTKVFAEVKMLSNPNNKDDIPPRIKFLLKDVVDLRAAGWNKTSRPSAMPEGPMKMSEVQQKWAKDHSKGGGKGAPAPLQDLNADDEWATVGKARRGENQGFKQSSTPQGSSTGKGSSSLATPTVQVRPATTRAEGSSNPFGLLESPQRKKEKRDKKEETWRRADTAPSLTTSGRSEWKPRRTEADGPERSNSSPSGGMATDKEPSEKECLEEMHCAIKELASSHDLDEAVVRVQALKVPPRYQKAVWCDMFAEISDQGAAARPSLISFVLRLVGVEEPRKEVLQRTALLEGLQLFVEDRYADLMCDVPKLPTILREELFPALGKEALSEKEITALIARMEEFDAS